MTGYSCGSLDLTGTLLNPLPPAGTAGTFANVLQFTEPTTGLPASYQPVSVYSCGTGQAVPSNYAYRLSGPGAGCGRVCLTLPNAFYVTFNPSPPAPGPPGPPPPRP